MTRWLCAHLPYFRTERITRASPATQANAIALVELRGDSVLLLAAGPQAQARGVRAGMTATAARSLAPGLVLIEHNPAAEHEDMHALAAALGRFTPRVHLDTPRAVLLDISGCAAIFGSESALAAQAAATIERLGYTVQSGLADNATAAYTLALGRGAAEIEGAPIEALRLDRADLAQLAALGIRTAGDLLALPPESLPARFSDDLTARLRQLRGESPEPFALFRPPETVTERLEFEGPTDRYDTLMFALRRLAAALEERLAALGAGALALDVRLRATEGEPLEFTVGLTRPTRESRSLAALLLGRFESVDRQDRWFDGVEARVPALAPLQQPQRDLFSGRDPGSDRALAELVDELAGRLGGEAVARAELTADPRPERSFAYRPFVVEAGRPATPAVARPVTMFDPHEVAVDCDAAGRPVQWHDGTRRSRLVSEPVERIHFGWWAGDGTSRDYFAVQDEQGARWWLMKRGSGWYIVGAF